MLFRSPGAVLGVINYLFFFSYRYSPYVTPRIREITTFYDSLIQSLASGLAEEIVYRLFIFSCVVFTFRNLYARIRPLWPSAVAVLPIAMALVLYEPAFASLALVFRANLRRAITILTLAGGFASTVFWPFTQWLTTQFGWREAVLVLAALNRLGAKHRLLPETNSPITAMRGRSVVLIGSPWYSRAARTLLERSRWSTDLDPISKEIAIVEQGSPGKVFVPKQIGRAHV